MIPGSSLAEALEAQDKNFRTYDLRKWLSANYSSAGQKEVQAINNVLFGLHGYIDHDDAGINGNRYWSKTESYDQDEVYAILDGV